MSNNPSEKKISPYDKFQALRRKPSYRCDYWDFLFWCRENHIDETEYLDHPEATEKAEELCKKYGITYLFNPSLNIPKHRAGSGFIEEKEIVEVLYPTDYRDLSEDELRRGIRPLYLPIPIFNKGDELIIKIDLKADKDVIVNKFKERLDYYQNFIIRDNSRMMFDRKVDKWEVWDAYNQTKSFKKTVKRLKDRASTYAKFINEVGITAEAPPKLNVSTVRKAYYRAFELVHEEKFDPDKHKPEKLPIKLKRTCDKCPEYSTCEALCPQALEYAQQDAIKGWNTSLLGEGVSNIPSYDYPAEES